MNEETYINPFPHRPYYRYKGEGLYQAFRFLGQKPWPCNIIIKSTKATFKGFEVVQFCMPVPDGSYLEINIGDYLIKQEGGTPFVITEKEFHKHYTEWLKEDYPPA